VQKSTATLLRHSMVKAEKCDLLPAFAFLDSPLTSFISDLSVTIN